MVSREDYYKVTEYHGEVWIRAKVVFDSTKDILQAINDLYAFTLDSITVESIEVDTDYTHSGLYRWTAFFTATDWVKIHNIEDCLEEAQDLLDKVLNQDEILDVEIVDYECEEYESETYWTD